MISAFLMSDKFANDLVYLEDYDSFVLYNGRYYDFVSNKDLMRLVWDFIKTKFPLKNISHGKLRDLTKLLGMECIRRADHEDFNTLAFADCLYDLKQFRTLEFTRDVICTLGFEFDFADTACPTPHFDKFLATSLVYKDDVNKPDTKLRELLQEMFGYFILGTLKAEAAFFLVGGGSNGKSKVTDLIRLIIGDKYVVSMSVRRLTTDRWATADLVGKRLNIATEDESTYISADVFKQLITGEQVTGERKFGDPFTFKPRTKYVFSTNKLPQFSDLNYGLIRRLHLLPFYRRFTPEEQDKDLGKKLAAELPGIMAWAIQGAKRLTAANFIFTPSSASQHTMEEFKKEISGVMQWFYGGYTVDDEAFTGTDLLYSEYKDWCSVNNKKPFSSHKFFRDLTNNIPGVKSTRNRDGENGVVRGRNIRMLNAFEKDALAEQGVEEIEDLTEIPL